MTQYKMVCLDIDGTLLNSQNELTPATKDAIKKVSQKGVAVVLVSARPPSGIQFLIDELGIQSTLVCFSGSLIMDGSQVLLSHCLPMRMIEEIDRHAREHDIHMSLYKGDEWFVQQIDYWAHLEAEGTHTSPHTADFAGLFREWRERNTPPNKVLCMAEREKIDWLNRTLSELYPEELEISPSKPTYLEIMPKNVSKPKAVEFLCQRYGVAREDVIAIGDNFNDLGMIIYAGLGIAMGNAPDAVKEQADDVTLSNDEDGVAAALREYCL